MHSNGVYGTYLMEEAWLVSPESAAETLTYS